MDTMASFEKALSLALQLAPKDRLKLIEQVAVSIEKELESPSSQAEEHWGQALNQLLDEMDAVEFIYPEIDDPVEWVKRLRAEERQRRLGNEGDF